MSKKLFINLKSGLQKYENYHCESLKKPISSKNIYITFLKNLIKIIKT
jgi:hypothetical protein